MGTGVQDALPCGCIILGVCSTGDGTVERIGAGQSGVGEDAERPGVRLLPGGAVGIGDDLRREVV